MEFYEYDRIGAGTRLAYNRAIEQADGSSVRNQLIIEREWLAQKRPMYNVFPGIVKSMKNLKLDKIPCGKFRLPVSTILLRMPRSIQSVKYDGYRLKSILIAQFAVKGDTTVIPIFLHFGKRKSNLYFQFRLALEKKCDASIEEYLDTLDLSRWLKVPAGVYMEPIRIIIGSVLIMQGREDELIFKRGTVAPKPVMGRVIRKTHTHGPVRRFITTQRIESYDSHRWVGQGGLKRKKIKVQSYWRRINLARVIHYASGSTHSLGTKKG